MRCHRTDISSFSLRDGADLHLASVHEDSDPMLAASDRMRKRHADASKVAPVAAPQEDAREDSDSVESAQERMRRRNAEAASR